MIEVALVLVLVISVAWGATIPPGRRFSWAMYSGSSKAFLWLRGEPFGRWAKIDELRLAPGAHYLREGDLKLLAEAGLPALDGLIVGSRGSVTVAHSPETGMITESLDGQDVLAHLAAALRRYECPEP